MNGERLGVGPEECPPCASQAKTQSQLRCLGNRLKVSRSSGFGARGSCEETSSKPWGLLAFLGPSGDTQFPQKGLKSNPILPLYQVRQGHDNSLVPAAKVARLADQASPFPSPAPSRCTHLHPGPRALWRPSLLLCLYVGCQS